MLERLLPWTPHRDGAQRRPHGTSVGWRRSPTELAIVWCPSSNLYTLGRTLTPDQVTSYPNIALGTDSPLSGVGDLLDEIRLAYGQLGIPAPLVYELVTSRAARLLRLNSETGLSAARLQGRPHRHPGPGAHACRHARSDYPGAMWTSSWKAEESCCYPPPSRTAFRANSKRDWKQISIDGVDRFLRAPVAGLWSETSAALGRTPTLSGRTLCHETGERSYRRHPFLARRSDHARIDHFSSEVMNLRNDCH